MNPIAASSPSSAARSKTVRGRLVRRSISILVVALAAPALQAQPTSAAGLRPSEPVQCTAFNQITLRDRAIEAVGDAIAVTGQCRVRLENCYIVARGVGIKVEGMGQVVLENSYVEGGLAAVHASGRSRVTYRASAFRGDLLADGLSRIDGDGDDLSKPGPGASEARIRLGAGGVTLETGTGESVTVGTGGVALEADDDTAVRVAGGRISLEAEDASIEIDTDSLIRLLPDASVEISADWRLVGGVYRASDSERLLRELGARMEADKVLLTLGGDVLFDFSSAAIRPQAADELAKIAHLLRTLSQGEILIDGHTDTVGADQANQKLSERRAIAVMRWLHEQEGIPVQILRGRGLGSHKPIAYNTQPDGSDNPAGRARNRRVEITFATRP